LIIKAREGDLLESQADVIFDVKGLAHPPDKTIAFPRFIPDFRGSRKRGRIFYRKVYALEERYNFLEKRFPHYLVNDPIFGERLSEVPAKDVKRLWRPHTYLQKLRDSELKIELETKALYLVDILQENSRVSWNKFGISGSLLAQLTTPRSDIDLIVYGKRNCIKIHESMKLLTGNPKEPLRTYTSKELETLYAFRSQDTRVDFGKFAATEKRKVLQGKFQQCDFYIRCIKDWNEVNEVYGDVRYKSVGYVRLKATISDDSEAIFTPCRYSLEKVQLLEGKNCGNVTEIASFRGRFCEQAKIGEVVVAQGKVERVETKTGDTFFRLLLGGRRSDFMVLAD